MPPRLQMCANDWVPICHCRHTACMHAVTAESERMIKVMSGRCVLNRQPKRGRSASLRRGRGRSSGLRSARAQMGSPRPPRLLRRSPPPALTGATTALALNPCMQALDEAGGRRLCLGIRTWTECRTRLWTEYH
jgi:hypothetical protein